MTSMTFKQMRTHDADTLNLTGAIRKRYINSDESRFNSRQALLAEERQKKTMAAKKKDGRKKARTPAQKAATARMLAALKKKRAGKKPHAKKHAKKHAAKRHTKKQPWGALRAKRLAKHPKRKPGPKKKGWGALAKKKAELASLKKQVTAAKRAAKHRGKGPMGHRRGRPKKHYSEAEAMATLGITGAYAPKSHRASHRRGRPKKHYSEAEAMATLGITGAYAPKSHRAKTHHAGRNAIVTAKAVRSGSGKSELVVPGASVVSARAHEITARHGNKGHAPVSVLLRRIKLLELDILKAVKRGDVDSEEPYVSEHDPAEIKAFLKS